ncbi:MAG: glucosaminidase domain-containing protein [Eubacterium sp.]|nr:glucosaminidase domain-containing protein [Eubacterium sp.]
MVTGHYLIGKTVYVFGDDGALTKTITRAKSKRATSAGKGTKTYTLIGMSTDEIIEKLGPLFTADQRKTGVLASVSMAQFILESWYGRSELALMANNCFGMKTTLSGNTWSGSKWDGKSVYKKQTKEEYTPGVKTTIVAIFRKYASIEDSIADHSAYLLGARDGTSLRYAGLKGCTSYRRAARIIKNGGYATDSTYVQQLCSIIKNLKLTRFDAKA